MNKLTSLSIFFPAFNEEENIPLVVKEALEIAPKIAEKYELIVINDGSKDNTVEAVEEIAKKNNHVRLVSHKTNLGYGNALKTGFYNAKYDYITYMDSDRQFAFSQIFKLLDQFDTADVVIGFRINRADKFVRRVNGKLWTLLCGLLLGIPYRDIDCGFKLMKREVIDSIPKLESSGATISAELLAKAKKKGFKIIEVGLEHRPRQFGTPTGGNPLHIFRAFRDLILLLPKI